MFNPNARWDRKLPNQQENLYDSEELNEKIWVCALFRGGKILPRYFIWNNHIYRIKEITYFWQERKGENLLNLFSVNTARGLFQISLSQKTLSWYLIKIY